jgi:hypothetical protein
LAVGGEDRGLPGTFGDELIEIVGLGQGEVPHGEVVEDQDPWTCPMPQTRLEASIRVSASQVGE